ncbi:MAG: hypothetical protein LC729_03605 [Acidobacteria bacterium]|nr:hypothetical protein [Acidobacteriota bacterium]
MVTPVAPLLKLLGRHERVRRDRIASACSYCAGSYGVTEQGEQAGIELLDEYEQHPSIRRLLADGYQVVTF